MTRSRLPFPRPAAILLGAALVTWTAGGAACAKRPTLLKGTSPDWSVTSTTVDPASAAVPGPLDAPAITEPSPSTTLSSSDPGLLAQTHQFPNANDPAWLARVADVGRAIVDGQPGEGLTGFFPRTAYQQVKVIHDPAADWSQRLLAQYDNDIVALHRALGPGQATFTGVTIPPAAVWVLPGKESNRIGYYRVYNSRLRFTVNGQPRTFAIASLISWRGQWYVVHLVRIT